MKKLLSFSNFVALVGVVTIFIGFAPAAAISNTVGGVNPTINLFTATFGGSFGMGIGSGASMTFSAYTCAGLVVAFALMILGILCMIAKIKFKIASLIGVPLFLASGILVGCTPLLLDAINIDGRIGITYFRICGGAIAVATLLCICGVFALADFIISIAKPKQEQVY